ncbi:MAG: CDP-alcohol phosphatidyltransferase family protein [Syntrophomonadaceae bacterium]
MIRFRDVYTRSNLLSLTRLLLSFPVYFLLARMENSVNYRIEIIAILVFAALTDFLDGYLARKYNEISEVGKIIDPLADKALIGVVTIQLFLLGHIPPVYFFSVIGRDLIIFLGGIYVTKKIGKVLPSNLLGKITVTFIAAYLLAIIFGFKDSIIYDYLYYISLILVYGSLLAYIIRAKESLTWNKNESVQEHQL